jgi:hypothetical protein
MERLPDRAWLSRAKGHQPVASGERIGGSCHACEVFPGHHTRAIQPIPQRCEKRLGGLKQRGPIAGR